MNEQQLNELNIFGLRELARRTGVSSPTSKKKDELIKDILAIQSGEKKPHVPKTKQGRPPKEFGYDFVDVFKPQSKTYPQFTKVVTLNQEKKMFENSDVSTAGGYVDSLGNNAFMWVIGDYSAYFIPPTLVETYGLKAGDKIVAEVEANNGQLTVKSIFNINNCPISKFSIERNDYKEIVHELPTEKIVFNDECFNDLDIKFGQSVYFYGSDNNENTVSIIKMLNSCEVERKMYLNISVADKNRIFLNLLNNCEQFVSELTDNIDDAKKVVSLATERAKRILEKGENVVLVIDDLLSVKSVDNDNLTLIKNLITLTKNNPNYGSITLFVIMPINTFAMAEKLADKRIQISNMTEF